MIGFLRGKLIACRPDRAMLDVGGVGYDVRIPLSTFYALSRASDAQDMVGLTIHTHVREDALQLYGFSTRDELETFELLIGISGVGPRLALAVLSGIGADELHTAVVQRNRERLQKIPGVGKKTAERILLELRDKLGVPDPPAGEDPARHAGADPGSPASIRHDAVSALVNLGYSSQVASRSVDRGLDGLSDATSLESVLRAALSALAR